MAYEVRGAESWDQKKLSKAKRARDGAVSEDVVWCAELGTRFPSDSQP